MSGTGRGWERAATPEEVQRIVADGLRAMDEHGEATGHDVSKFHTPSDRIAFTCSTCNEVVFNGPPFTVDA